MELNTKTARDFINPLLSKKNIDNSSFEAFKLAFEAYKKDIKHQHVSSQTEPNIVSNTLKPFIESFAYNAQSTSQKGQSGIDLTIQNNGKTAVLIEAKKANSKEMITTTNPNQKALHEAVLYFMRERDAGNDNLCHIIITDFYNWFIFDAKEFEMLFWQNNNINKLFLAHNDPDSLFGKNTSAFYDAMAIEIPKLKADLITDESMKCAYFNVEQKFTNKELIALYKLLSADTLLKQFNPNDANALNRDFYNELLYILGLEEIKDGSKKVIACAKAKQQGTFYQNIEHKLKLYNKPHDFETIIRLIIIWVNRILFLKLLESQIVKWTSNKEHKFLHAKKISQYDQLEELFFEVLAKKVSDRNIDHFNFIPYLNSSLFEIHADENTLLKVSNLSDDAKITYYSKTVVKDAQSKRKTGGISTLSYLFEFLDAYDFGSDSSDEVVTENKILINASVLGLIFEKINGYKDGSFYTPSFITMYMARESIRKSVIDKFNISFTAEDFSPCENWVELMRYCSKNSYKNAFVEQANPLINSITICDPAVGSGHFLVSALNELIIVKYELGLLHFKGMQIDLANDELLITLDGDWFEYTKPKNFNSPNHHVQKLLFEEKQRIIENQLFGVDINPNSTQITKLRLWIELLKNSYYDLNYQLITLPNIDINIKTGNSLISRFALTDDMSKDKKVKVEIEKYKQAVKNYKENIGNKHEVMESIKSIKTKFKETLQAESKTAKSRNGNLTEYYKKFGLDGLDKQLRQVCLEINILGMRQVGMFDDEQQGDKASKSKLLKSIIANQNAVVELESGKIYQNAFEWRFEFPEVLDENGNYVGFDVVIGNPPYIKERDAKEIFEPLRKTPHWLAVIEGKMDLWYFFLHLAFDITKTAGILSYITTSYWMKSDGSRKLINRIYNDKTLNELIYFDDYPVFDGVSGKHMIHSYINSEKESNHKVKITITDNSNFKENIYTQSAKYEELDNVINENYINIENRTGSFFDGCKQLDDFFFVSQGVVEAPDKLSKKMISKHQTQHKVGEGVFVVSKKELDNMNLTPVELDVVKPYLNTSHVVKYGANFKEEYLLFLDKSNRQKVEQGIFPNIKSHLDKYSLFITSSNAPYGLHRDRSSVVNPFEKPKLICKGMFAAPEFTYDDGVFYTGFSFSIINEKDRNYSLKYLLAIMNSKLGHHWFQASGKKRGIGVDIGVKVFRLFPVREATVSCQQSFITIVDDILTAKKTDPKANICALEAQIDQMVYKLYNLTFAEVREMDPDFALTEQEYCLLH